MEKIEPHQRRILRKKNYMELLEFSKGVRDRIDQMWPGYLKALQSIANELGENIVYRKERVNDDDLHYVPYYTPRTYEVLTQRLVDDNKYLKQY